MLDWGLRFNIPLIFLHSGTFENISHQNNCKEQETLSKNIKMKINKSGKTH